MTTYVYARKGNLTTVFTQFIWNNMGKGKNEWEQITKSQYDALTEGKTIIQNSGTTNAVNDIEVEAQYKQLMEQAKGFVTDEKLEDALGKYKEAQALKDSPYLKDQISKLEKQIAENTAVEEQLSELIESGDSALADEDYAMSIEMYSSAQDAIVIPMPESREEMIPLSEIVKYLNPPVDIVKWQEEYVEKLTLKAKRIMFNSDIFDRQQVAETATGKNLDMQNVYDTLHPFAVRFGKVWKFGVETMAKLADRGENLVSSYTFGKDFKLKSLDSLVMDLSIANNIGNPSLVQHLNDDIAQIIFSEKPIELQRYQLKELYNPFSGKSEKEIILLIASPHVSRRQKVLHANYGTIFDELELEYAANKKNFYEQNRSSQREAIYKKVDEIIAILDSENPSLELFPPE